MITEEKLKTIRDLAEKLVESDIADTKSSGNIIIILINLIDDLRDEVIWLKDENESIRFDLQDKKFEKRQNTPRRTQRTQRPQAYRINPFDGGF